MAAMLRGETAPGQGFRDMKVSYRAIPRLP